MRPASYIALALCTIVLLAGCHSNKSDIRFNRFERVLFEGGADNLQERLAKERETYTTPLINCEPESGQYMQQVEAFVNDPFIREIYRLTDSCYHNLGHVEKDLGKAVGNLERLAPEMVPARYYTMITGDMEDYQNRVFCYDGDLVLSIDHYVLPYTAHIGYCNCPMYMVSLSTSKHIASDCMAAIARSHIPMPDGEPTLLDYIVMEGKVQYLLKETMPWENDTIRLRYTGEQLKWMKNSEKNVWGYFIQNNLLYEKDMGRIHNFIDEAPKTNAFRNSAPRTTNYIGLEIVSAYAKKTHCGMTELFEETDSQKILTKSGYRPR